MPYFKDQQNALHFLDDAAYAHLLPAGSCPVTDTEVAAMQAAADAANAPYLRKVEILAQLINIDAKSIRPMVEGDTAFLAQLRAPVAALRAELATLP